MLHHPSLPSGLRLLLLLRNDVAQTLDVASEAGWADALAWFFVRAVPEYDLYNTLDADTLAMLNAPAAPLGPDSPIAGPSGLSVLMGLTWRHRADVQAVFDIANPIGRAQFVVWFLSHGVHELKLQSLISEEWRTRLLSPGTFASVTDLPYVGYLAWQARQDLQAAFDLSTPEGQQSLRAWTSHELSTGPHWQWLSDSATVTQPALSEAKRRWRTRPVPEPGVNLIGFAQGELGIGEDVRMAVAACEAAGIAYSVINISTGVNTRQADAALAESLKQISDAPYGVNVFCLTGFDTVRVFFEQGAHLFANRYNIGWWPWELPVWPRDWLPAFDVVDEIWAATEFTRAVYVKATQKPVCLMPLPVSIDRLVPTSRQRLGLPAAQFLFLYIFDFNSYLPRKNPFAAVRAFRQAFAEDHASVGLVLKTMNSDPGNPIWRRFVRECAKDVRITLLDKTLDRGHVLGLVKACDAYISLHRAEGFGRTLAEAMMFGKPVVGTDFSGSADFLTPETGFPVRWRRKVVEEGDYPFVSAEDRAWWADPDVADAAVQMQAARRQAMTKERAKSVMAFARQQFSPSRIGQRMQDRLSVISQHRNV
jgi:glycosyltransferase involved in cell wall biosynthesis